MIEKTIKLQDGRILSYALYGPDKGQPVLYFHGTPSSRLEVMIADMYGVNMQTLLQQFRIQLIAVDRPGMGLSTFNKKGSFLSFADDVHELVRHLAIQQCKIMCWSGGGPYTLAMAYKYPSIITGVFIIAGFTRRFDAEVVKQLSANKLYFGAAKKVPWLLRWWFSWMRKKKYKFKKPVSQRRWKFPDNDYKLMKEVEKLNGLIDVSIRESIRQDPGGAVYEARSYFKDFGFKLSHIHQPVYYWRGTEDETVGLIHAKTVEQQIPNNAVYYKKDEGHLSVYIHYLPEVLESIACIGKE